MTCSCLCYRHPSRESPFLIDLGKLIVQGKKIVLVIYAVLTMEDFLEGELLIFINRKERTVDVRILLIAVDDEGDDVFLSIFICPQSGRCPVPTFLFLAFYGYARYHPCFQNLPSDCQRQALACVPLNRRR